MSKIEYKRICKYCKKEIFYSCYKSYYSAKTRNSGCRSCRSVNNNKSETRDNSKNKNINWKGYKDIPFNWFSKYFLRNGKSNRTGTITIKDVYNLWIKQNKKCILSGLDIGWYDCKYNNKNHTCSIDRINNSKEYSIDNIQLVHKDVNIMRNAFSVDYYIQICKLVTQNNK